jgi:hypothetical protein
VSKSLQKLLPKRFKDASEMRGALVKLYQQVKTGELIRYWSSEPRALPALRPLYQTCRTLSCPTALMSWGWCRCRHAWERAAKLQPPQAHANLLITCCDQEVWFYHWSDQVIEPTLNLPGIFRLPTPVRQFVFNPSKGGVLITDTSLHLLSMSHGLGRIAVTQTPMMAAVAETGRWFALCHADPNHARVEVDLHQLQGWA